MWQNIQGIFYFLDVKVQCVLLPILAKGLSVSQAEPPTIFADTLLLVPVHHSFLQYGYNVTPSPSACQWHRKKSEIHELFSYLSSERHSNVSQVVSTFLFSGGLNGIHSLINAI